MSRKIDRFYKPLFFYPPPHTNKEFGSFFHWQSPKKGPLIVFHPGISYKFDPFSSNLRQHMITDREMEPPSIFNHEFNLYETFIPSEGRRVEILVESYNVDSNPIRAIEGFIQEMPNFLRCPVDFTIWDDTGFWSARKGEDNYIGVSESGAKSLINGGWDGEFAYVLCDADSIITFTARIGEKTTCIDIYLTNHFLPFAELRNAIQKTLNGIGTWKSLEMRFDDYETIIGKLPRRIMRNFNEELSSFFNIEPIAVVKAPLETYQSIVIKRKFGRTPWEAFNSLNYILATHRGTYWQDSDFEPDGKFTISHFIPHFLKNCIVIDCSFVEQSDY